MGTFLAEMAAPPVSASRTVLTVSSNKGGVGKTTIATNLAIYLRALREELPVLLVSLDDQKILDRMLALRPLRPGDGHLKHGWAERSFARVIQLGDYGVHFVPSAPEVTLLKARAEEPRTLRRILERTEWEGLVILDTKSDLEALTLNACHAADRVLIPVADWTSLEEAGKSFAWLERAGLGRERGRVLLTLVDRRTRVRGSKTHLMGRLLGEIRRRGWPYYRTYLSRSPTVESLNSGTGKPLSILHHARGTPAHGQMRELAEEVLQDLGLSTVRSQRGEPAELWGPRRDALPLRWSTERLATGLLGALRRR
jgi:chromosome partitioning protein